MAFDLRSLLDPRTTVVVTSECQNGVLGEASYLPELAEAARDRGSRTWPAWCTAPAPPGCRSSTACSGAGPTGGASNTNGRIFAMANKVAPAMEPGSDAALPLPEIGLSPDDLISGRYHGADPLEGTDLDSLLRNCGARTVVVAGVSVNVALVGLTLGLLNRGYQVVVPRDAVAGIPVDYSETMLDNTYAIIATVLTTDDVLAAWA